MSSATHQFDHVAERRGHARASGAATVPAGPVRLDARLIGRWVVGATAVVIALGILREVFFHTVGPDTALQDLRHIDMGAELSLPAWYSSLLMTLSALLLAVTAGLARRENDPWTFHWGLLAVVFLGMSLDESASFHESLMVPLREMFGFTGYLYYAWVVPGMIAVAILGLYYLPFLLQLPRRVAARFALAGFIFVGGALGVEMIGGEMDQRLGNTHPLWSPVMLIEESMEFIGVTLFVLALLDYLTERWPNAKLGMSPR